MGIAYAMQISMQADEEESAAAAAAADEEPMEVDQSEKDEDDYSEALTDPEFLANVLEGLPGVDPQSEEVKKTMDKLKSSGDKEKKDEKKEDSGSAEKPKAKKPKTDKD